MNKSRWPRECVREIPPQIYTVLPDGRVVEIQQYLRDLQTKMKPPHSDFTDWLRKGE